LQQVNILGIKIIYFLYSPYKVRNIFIKRKKHTAFSDEFAHVSDGPIDDILLDEVWE